MATIQTESRLIQGQSFIDDIFESSLEHYGVKGMKWGVRKDQYRKSRRERSAKRYEARASKYQNNLANSLTKNQTNRRIKKQNRLRTKIDREIKDASLKRSGIMTSRERRQIAGTAAVTALMATAVAYHTLNSGEARIAMDRGKQFLLNKDISFKKNAELANKNLSSDEIYEKIVKKINPGYGQPGTKVNCRRATFAYEMNRRGYDVSATRTTNAYGQNRFGMYKVLNKDSVGRGTGAPSIAKAIYTDKGFRDFMAKTNRQGALNIMDLSDPFKSGISKANDIFSGLIKQPNGSRGELGMTWYAGGGHSMSYEIIKGMPVIFDNQTGKVYKTPDSFKDLASKMSESSLTRLDNIELNEDFLRRWIKNSS